MATEKGPTREARKSSTRKRKAASSDAPVKPAQDARRKSSKKADAASQGSSRHPPPGGFQTGAEVRAWLASLPPPPKSYAVGQDLNWDAPWAQVVLRVELPFWLLLDNVDLTVNVEGHDFP